jgi:hypothetical protein
LNQLNSYKLKFNREFEDKWDGQKKKRKIDDNDDEEQKK